MIYACRVKVHNTNVGLIMILSKSRTESSLTCVLKDKKIISRHSEKRGPDVVVTLNDCFVSAI